MHVNTFPPGDPARSLTRSFATPRVFLYPFSMTASPPKCPRHLVRVRGIDTEYCKARPGIPEWWHFPECDRNYYFAPGEDASSSCAATAPNGAVSAPCTDKREDRRKDNGGKHQTTGGKERVKQMVKGGYCAMCKVKHDNAKKHADSKGHRGVLQKLMAQKMI